MNIGELASSLDLAEQGHRMRDMCAELYPICRSITGDGVRQTLASLSRMLPLDIHEVPSGTKVFDWTVPPEWNIRDAYVLDEHGNRVVDFRRSNLHVMSYSRPVRTRLSLSALKEHAITLPEHPEWIPYRTSYYDDRWAFCLAQSDLDQLTEGEYDVVIDSSLEPGALTYGECVVPGASTDEVLLSCHVCHPSLANDNLSGIALAAFVGETLLGLQLRYSYRLLFIPGTIGSIAWLARNEANVDRIRHGLVLTGVGDPGPFTYKRSRRGNADVDRVVAHVLRRATPDARVLDFSPYGYDERQFCSPAFNLPVGRLGRTPHGEYPEYHTSADDLSFIEPLRLGEALRVTLNVIATLEGNRRYLNTNPKCEPQLGRRGLYRAIGGHLDHKAVEMALLWVLNLSDGDHDLLGIADRAGLPFAAVRHAADVLIEHDLLEPVGESS
jgi:aminopeptidase-like protein